MTDLIWTCATCGQPIIYGQSCQCITMSQPNPDVLVSSVTTGGAAPIHADSDPVRIALRAKIAELDADLYHAGARAESQDEYLQALHETNNKLRSERDDLQRTVTAMQAYAGRVAEKEAEIAELKREVERLRKALTDYWTHSDDCTWIGAFSTDPTKCNCGLQDILRKGL